MTLAQNSKSAILTHHCDFVSFTSKKTNKLVFIISTGVFVALFLNLFLPFGTSGARIPNGELPFWALIIYLSFFGLVWVFTLLALEFLVRPVFKKILPIQDVSTEFT